MAMEDERQYGWKSLRIENQGLQRTWAKEILQGSRTRCCHMNQGTFPVRRAGALLFLPGKIRSLLYQVGMFYYNYPLFSLSVEHWRRGHLTSNLWDPRPQHAISRPAESPAVLDFQLNIWTRWIFGCVAIEDEGRVFQFFKKKDVRLLRGGL